MLLLYLPNIQKYLDMPLLGRQYEVTQSLQVCEVECIPGPYLLES